MNSTSEGLTTNYLLIAEFNKCKYKISVTDLHENHKQGSNHKQLLIINNIIL